MSGGNATNVISPNAVMIDQQNRDLPSANAAHGGMPVLGAKTEDRWNERAASRRTQLLKPCNLR